MNETWTPIIVATGLAGILSPFLTHITKTVFGVDSLRAYAIHLGVSALTSLAAFAITGGLTLSTFASKAPQVAVISSTLFVIYKAASGLKISPTPPSTEDPPPVE
jgi:hypothetical protein